MDFPSKLIGDAVTEFSRLPGIGKKTALRLVLHLLNKPVEEAQSLGNAVVRLREDVQYCIDCFSICEAERCSICSNVGRNQDLICVVESIRELIAIENTKQYHGLYHVLGGVISPVDGIGPEQLKVDELIERVKAKEVKEVLMAISPTMEGDTTIFYISKRLESHPAKITTIARGVSFGGELEYVDEMTLARSIATRLPYENYLVKR